MCHGIRSTEKKTEPIGYTVTFTSLPLMSSHADRLNLLPYFPVNSPLTSSTAITMLTILVCRCSFDSLLLVSLHRCHSLHFMTSLHYNHSTMLLFVLTSIHGREAHTRRFKLFGSELTVKRDRALSLFVLGLSDFRGTPVVPCKLKTCWGCRRPRTR